MSEDTRVYELGFLLVPNTAENEVSTEVETLKKLITKSSGNVLSESTPEFIDLAYQMEKNVAGKKLKWTQGYFGFIKFEADPGELESLKKALDGAQSLIRYILVKTHAENSIVFKKPKVEAKRPGAGDEIDEAELEAIEAEEDAAEHEKLPDLAADIEAPTPASEEA